MTGRAGPAPRTRAALAELEAATAFITPGEHVTSLTEEFLRQLVSAALAGKRLGLAVEGDRVLARLEAAEAVVQAVHAAWDEYRRYDTGTVVALDKVREAALALDRAAQYRGARQGDL